MEITINVRIDEENDDPIECMDVLAQVTGYLKNRLQESEITVKTPDGQLVTLGEQVTRH